MKQANLNFSNADCSGFGVGAGKLLGPVQNRYREEHGTAASVSSGMVHSILRGGGNSTVFGSTTANKDVIAHGASGKSL